MSDNPHPNKPEPSIEFPTTFDLRIVYELATGANIARELQAIYERMSVPCSIIQAIAKEGARYGKIASRITVADREQMYALYAEVQKLESVRAAI